MLAGPKLRVRRPPCRRFSECAETSEVPPAAHPRPAPTPPPPEPGTLLFGGSLSPPWPFGLWQLRVLLVPPALDAAS